METQARLASAFLALLQDFSDFLLSELAERLSCDSRSAESLAQAWAADLLQIDGASFADADDAMMTEEVERHVEILRGDYPFGA